jgi:hypothetical protein
MDQRLQVQLADQRLELKIDRLGTRSQPQMGNHETESKIDQFERSLMAMKQHLEMQLESFRSRLLKEESRNALSISNVGAQTSLERADQRLQVQLPNSQRQLSFPEPGHAFRDHEVALRFEPEYKLRDMVEKLRIDMEESSVQNARANIELHNKIARESALCCKMVAMQRDDILQFISREPVWWLDVKVCGAYDLRSVSHFCEVEVPRTGVQRQTGVLNGANPEWNAEFSIPDYMPGDAVLFTVFESSMMFRKVFVGKAVLSGNAIREHVRFRGDLPLEELKEIFGKQYLTVEASQRLKP